MKRTHREELGMACLLHLSYLRNVQGGTWIGLSLVGTRTDCLSMGGAHESSTSLNHHLCAQLSQCSPQSSQQRCHDMKRERRQADGMLTIPLSVSTSARHHHWPPLRRGRRLHGGSAMEPCLGAVRPMVGDPLRRIECGAH